MRKFCFNRSLLLVMIVFIFSCSDNKQVSIKFADDHSSIIMNNFDEASLLQLRNAYAENADSNRFVNVLVQPSELDSLQDEIPIAGKVNLKGDSLIFIPAAPFKKNKSYVVESFINVKFANSEKLISGHGNYNLMPQRQILKW